MLMLLMLVYVCGTSEGAIAATKKLSNGTWFLTTQRKSKLVLQVFLLYLGLFAEDVD